MARQPRQLWPDLSDAHRLGARLRELRLAAGLTQRQLAAAVFFSPDTIRRIEDASRGASVEILARFDSVLGTGGELVRLFQHSHRAPDQQTAGSSDLGEPADSAAILQAAQTRYELMYRQVGGAVLGPHLDRFLRTQLGSPEPVVQPAALYAAARLRAIAGICAYDDDRQPDAARHFHLAQRDARRADDPGLGGYILALRANQALGLDQPRRAVAHIDSALQISELSHAQLADLHVMRARAFAQQNQTPDCLSALATAAGQNDLIVPELEPAHTGYIHTGLIQLKSAEALLDIGRARQARDLIDDVLGHGDPHPRSHAHTSISRAMIACAQGSNDEAITLGGFALEQAQNMASWRLRRRLVILFGQLHESRGNRSYQALGDRMKELLVMRI